MRLLPILLVALFLSACSAMEDPLDEGLLTRLNGAWQQVDGNTTVSFYQQDATVKLSMPDEKPPVRLLTSLENNKDHGIGFSIGDRWGGPVYVELADDGASLTLKFPPSDPRLDDGPVLRFTRAR